MDLIIFDLDGTLVDSRQDIATSVNELLTRLGRPELPSEQIFDFIGNGVRRLLDRALGESAGSEELDQAVRLYLQIYGRRLLETTSAYPGVREALAELEALQSAPRMAVLTNKPTKESLEVLEGLDLMRYFDQVHGGDSFPRRKPDPMGADALIENTGARRERTLMVGDSRVDYETALNARIRVSLVTYGIGAKEVQALSPDYFIDDMRELLPIVGPE